MEVFLTYDSDTSYVREDDEEPFTSTLPYVPVRTGNNSRSYGDKNAVELSSDLEISSDVK